MKSSRKNMISRRVGTLRKRVRVNTQKMRRKTLDRLEEIFDLAVSLAKGELKTQTVSGFHENRGAYLSSKRVKTGGKYDDARRRPPSRLYALNVDAQERGRMASAILMRV